MDNRKKIYTVITVVLAVLQLYALYNIIDSFLKGYSLEWRFILFALPVVTGITALLLFVLSGYKRSGLLRLYMCYELFSFPFTLLFYIGFFTSDYGAYRPPADLFFYIGVLIDLLYITVCSVGLWYLSKQRVAKISYYGQGNDRTGLFEPAGGGLRFANRIIDGFMILFVLFKGLNSLFWGGEELAADSSSLLVLAEAGGLLVYYLLLEGIYKTTAGKCATATTIVNERGERPHFGQVLGRSFCRLIPFEAFSFLGDGARGWHDSLTNTWVVQTTDKDEAAADEITLDAELNTQ